MFKQMYNAVLSLIKRIVFNNMWNLDDTSKYLKVHSFTFNDVFTFGSNDDIKNREKVRQVAMKNFPKDICADFKCWAFRISVRTLENKKQIDIDNIPKIIIDAFCKEQIIKDKEKQNKSNQDKSEDYPDVGIFENDTIEFVKIVEVGVIDDPKAKENLTKVEIFAILLKNNE